MANWLSGWAKRLKITVDADVIDAALSGFPVPVYISEASGIGDVDASCVFDELTSDANRKKIAITTDDGETQCYVEIQRWDDANEKAWLHTKLTSVSESADTDLYLYYDSTHADNTAYVGDTTDAAAQAVWDSDFSAVYHLNQSPAGGANCILDSTTNAKHATPTGSMTSDDLVDAKWGKGIDFDGSDDAFDTPLAIMSTSAGTVEGIGKLDTTASKQRLFGEANASNQTIGLLGFTTDGGATAWQFALLSGSWYSCQGPNGVTAGVWYHVAGTWGASGMNLLANGVSLDTDAKTGGCSTSSGTWIGEGSPSGGERFNGILDELRISKTARSAAWLKATYHGLFDSLLTFSGEEILAEITDAAALGDTLDALHLVEILSDGVGLGDTIDGYYLRETVIDAVGMGATFDPLHLVETITDGAGLGDSLYLDIEAVVAILDGAGLGDTVDGYYLREAITDATALSDAFDGYFLRETITDAAGIGDSAARTLEIPRTLADTAGMGDAVVCLNWSEWLRLNSGQALKRFYFTLTGDGETPAVADAVIPISSFQARLRQGEPTYLSVVIPDLDTYSAIVSARSNGQMVIDMALILDGVEAVREEICRVDLEDINIYEGARNKSISLSGHATETYTTKITALTGASYYNLSGGLRRYRCAMDPYIKPGDTVRVNSEEFEVGYITISRSVGSETMEVVEAES